MIEFLDRYGQIWAGNFGITILQDTFFLGIVFFALYWLRNANARTRYIIAMIGILKLLLPALIPISLLSRFLAFSNPMIEVQIGEPAISASADQLEPAFQLSLIGLFFLIWLMVVLISLLIPVITTVRLKIQLRNARPIRFGDFVDEAIAIYQSDKINMPMTLGLFSNKIFVPAQWDSWSAECRTMILQHEIAHIKRWDGFFRLLQMVVQAIYFFHPLVWILNSRINQYREMACDDVSVAAKRNSALEYSRYLVKIAEEMTLTEPGYSSASALIRQRNELLNRVQYQIMEVAMKHISKKKLGAILAILLLSFSLLSFSLNSNPPVDEPGNVAVQEKAKIIGTIKDGKTGKPIEGAEVRIEGMDLAAVSDAEGNYAIAIAEFTAGNYQIKASKLGYKMVKVATVKVEENKTMRLDFVLKPADGKTQIEEQTPVPVKEKQVQKEKLQKGVEIPPPPKEKLVTIEEQEYRKQEELTNKEKQQGEIPPPPPPPLNDEKAWINYDAPPDVVGGFGSLAKALKYPESARKAGTGGTVQLSAQIDEQGKVQEVKILESLTEDCDQAAIAAVKSVTWKPAMKDGKPVAVWVTVPFKFNLK